MEFETVQLYRGLQLYSKPLRIGKGHTQIIAEFEREISSGVSGLNLSVRQLDAALTSLVHGVVLLPPEYRFPQDILGDVASYEPNAKCLRITYHRERIRALDAVNIISLDKPLYLCCSFTIQGWKELEDSSLDVNGTEPIGALVTTKPLGNGKNLLWEN